MNNYDDMGPCCCCGGDKEVRNFVCLPRRGPVPGAGWSCLVCNLPPDGASYICCDQCLKDNRPPREVIAGYPSARERLPIAMLSEEVFEHDQALHEAFENRST